MIQINPTYFQPHSTLQSSKVLLDNLIGSYSHTLESLRHKKPGFFEIPSHIDDQVDHITNSLLSFDEKYITDIVVLGIGGSSLGPRVIYEYASISGALDSLIHVHFLDNIDPVSMRNIEDKVNIQNTIFLAISKSGMTPETVAQYQYYIHLIQSHSLSVKERMIVITDMHNGYLREQATVHNLVSFVIPSEIGGRYSVLTPVGLVLAHLIGLDIRSLLVGADNAIHNTLTFPYSTALLLAAMQYEAYSSGKTIHVMMPYSDMLRSFGHWCVQLYGESLGKEKYSDGVAYSVGITPLPAIGVTDQHSQLQLFKQGPNDKLVILIKPKPVLEDNYLVPEIDNPSLQYLSHVSFADLLDAEFEATRRSLMESDRSSITLETPPINEEILGELFMTIQITTALLGEMMGINAFDQPGVERGKELTKDILSKKN